MDTRLMQFLPSDEYLTAIGQAAVRWSFLESLLDTAIHHLLNLDNKKGFAVTDEITSVHTRFAILRQLLKPHISGPKLKELDKLKKKTTSKLAPKRHDAVHSLWSEGFLGYSAYRSGKSTRRNPQKSISPSPDEIQNDAEAIYKGAVSLGSFLIENEAFPSPLPSVLPLLGSPPHSP